MHEDEYRALLKRAENTLSHNKAKLAELERSMQTRLINSRTQRPYTLHEKLMIESALPSGVSFEDWYAHGEQLPPCPVAQVADYLASDMPEFYRKPVQVWQAKLKRVKELDSIPEKNSSFLKRSKK